MNNSTDRRGIAQRRMSAGSKLQQSAHTRRQHKIRRPVDSSKWRLTSRPPSHDRSLACISWTDARMESRLYRLHEDALYETKQPSKLVEAAVVDLPFSGVKSSIAQSMLVDQGCGSWCQGQLHGTISEVSSTQLLTQYRCARSIVNCAPSKVFVGSSQHIFAMKFLLLLPWLNFKNTQFLECNSLATRSEDVAHCRQDVFVCQ